MCDVAYLICAERVDRMSFAAVTAGAEVDPDEQRREFDDWLHSELKTIDPDKADLMRALGVGPWRRSRKSS